MAPCHSNTPCFVPPHPNLLAKTRAHALNFQGAPNAHTIEEVTGALSGEARLPGMNDGMIFPESYFKEPTSIMAMSTAALQRTPLRGNMKVIIVLVEFQDVKMASGTKQHMKDLFFSTGKITTGSVTEYYSEVSNGKISFSGEVVGPFTLSHDMAYYANNASGLSESTPNASTMADEAFKAAVGSTNWSQYDNDGNGYVDAFVVVHAGPAAEVNQNAIARKREIWSLKWVLPKERKVDGVKVYGFLTVPEDAKCGVCAHEIGHLVFGWPDLYDTDYSSSGIGNWCLMSFGSWGGNGDRPVHPSAWCKANQGWIKTVTETENHQITLQDVKSGFTTHRLWTNGDSSSKEYYLIENRQLTGFDKSLDGAGLLVWHVDDNVFTNNDESHPKVKLMQADGLDQLKGPRASSDAGDAFPGLSNNSTFNATSNPNSKAYAGNDTYVSVTKIPRPAASMTFNITVKPMNQAPLGDFNPELWYRLKNTFQPNAYSLDVINDNGLNSKGLLQMARDGNFSGQHWQIKSNGHGTYSIRALFLGPNRQLDAYAHDKLTPVLQPSAFAKGQFWQIKPWGDGTWHLENAYSGQFLYLDTMEGGPKIAMNQANPGRPTQRWTISPIREIIEPEFV